MSRKKDKKPFEFSKLIILGVMSMFFIVAFVGIYLCLFVDCNLYTILCSFVAPSIVTALGFYYNKASKENVEKIKNSREENNYTEM